MSGPAQLRLVYYADDLTGATDALEQLSRAGLRTRLFLAPPTPAELAARPELAACGVAGLTRSLGPAALERALRPALASLRTLGVPHVHYKVCSTFDSSPRTGNLGRVLALGRELLPAAFVPLLAAAPGLGRYTVFGNHFARYGIGSQGAIYRLDRHPAISRHPITPMGEADLRQHLARQTKLPVAGFDLLQLALPAPECRARLAAVLADQPAAVLFDALTDADLTRIGSLLDDYAQPQTPLFSIGSSGVEAALCAHWRANGKLAAAPVPTPGWPATPILVGSGSCSPVTAGQIEWARQHGFALVPLRAAALAETSTRRGEQQRATRRAAAWLAGGRSVILYTTRTQADPALQAQMRGRSAAVLGTALGEILRATLQARPVARVCLAGGDTASFAARALGITALDFLAPLTPGAPLCRALAPGAPVAGLELVLKGGQVGAENFFASVQAGQLNL